MRSNQELLKSKNQLEHADSLEISKTGNQSGGGSQVIFPTKVQRRRQRSRSVGRDSAVQGPGQKSTFMQEMVSDPAYFDEMLMCAKCDKETRSLI
jgi:hypothetical protein